MSFSIIIPTFNAENTIDRAILSVTNQSFKGEVEILVVDDQSHDETCKRVAKARNEIPNLSLYNTEKNGGPGRARNYGISVAKNNWILFLDADDELSVDALESISLKISENERNSISLDVIAFDFIQKDGESSLISERVHRKDLKLLEESSNTKEIIGAFLKNIIDPSVIYNAYRRDFIINNRISFRDGLHEDVDFSFEVASNARRYGVLKKSIYVKWNNIGSIINTISIRHIEGYFGALKEIRDRLTERDLLDLYAADFNTGVINITSSRLIRVVNDLIIKKDDIKLIINAIHSGAKNLYLHSIKKPAGQLQTKYEIIFLELFNVFNGKSNIENLITRVLELKDYSWSCYDLQNSVFLRPDEIRTCCKRFFQNGKLKGDVSLLDNNGNDEFVFSYEDIKNAKLDLHMEINRNNSEECSGCPFLTFSDWGKPLDGGVKYLSLEYHSLCNMRCNYCDDTYYGGKKPRYSIPGIVDSLVSSGSLDNVEYVVWGGGEPVIEKNFQRTIARLSDAASNVRQRVITNCTVYSHELERLLSKDKAFIVTSLDAGTEEVFQKIRGFDDFDKVLQNLSRYAQVASKNVIIKYILLPENSHMSELEAFVAMIKRYRLQDCNFQISCDFKSESVQINEIVSIVRLAHLLENIGVRFKFVDDLVWQRLPKMNQDNYQKICDALEVKGLKNSIEAISKNNEIIIWGTGAQADLLIQKSWYLQNSSIAFFVDPRPNKVGTKFREKPVLGPEVLVSSNLKIVIAAVQSAPFIYQAATEMRVEKNRFINSLFF